MVAKLGPTIFARSGARGPLLDREFHGAPSLSPDRAGAAGPVLSGMLATGAASPAPGAETQERSVKLFKVVTVKDEVVIGLTAEELKSLGTGPDLDLLAQRLASVGQITVWQYAVRKASDGALQQAPLRRVAILRSDAMRIEPYATPLPVVAPAATSQ